MEKDFDRLLTRTARIAADWLGTLDERPVGETVTAAELRARWTCRCRTGRSTPPPTGCWAG